MSVAVSSHAQLHLPVNTGFAQDMKKVLRDYPNQFTHLQGPLLDERTQVTDYEVNFNISGAENAVIRKYSAKGKPIVSWEATVLTSESFEEAARKYKSLFSQFNHMAVRMDNGVTFYLKGQYETPTEEAIYNSSLLLWEKADAYIRPMKLEVSMQYELLEWKVRVKIFEREREDDERGDMIDEEELD